MGVDIYFFIEVKDSDGSWHLVKWYSDGHFDDKAPTEWDIEKSVEIDGKKMVEKYEFWPGLSWRDEIGWARHWDSLHTSDGLPDDVSEELDAMLKQYGEKEKEHHVKMFGAEDPNFDYKRKYGYIYLDEMYEHCSTKFEEWKGNLKKRVRDKQLDEINKRIDNLEKISLGKTDKPYKMKKVEEEYEDTVEYYFEDALEDILSLKRETNEVYFKACQFTDNNWFESKNVRVIYYFS